MKKFILLTIPITIGIVVIASQQVSYASVRITDLTMENIEALTDSEGGSSNSWDCWSSLKDNGGGAWQCGNPCVWHEHKAPGSRIGTCYK